MSSDIYCSGINIIDLPGGPQTPLWGNPHAPPDVHCARGRCELVPPLLLLRSLVAVLLSDLGPQPSRSAALKHFVPILTLRCGFFFFFFGGGV